MHETKTLILPPDLTNEKIEVQIDVDIVPLILALWQAGYETSFSCQGGFEPFGENGAEIYVHGYVSFVPSQDVHSAIEIVSDFATPTSMEHHYVSPYSDVIRFVRDADRARWGEITKDWEGKAFDYQIAPK